MDAIESLKQVVQEGRIDAAWVVELIAALQRQLQPTQQQLQAANTRIQELEKKLGGTPTDKVDEPFSLSAEELRQEACVKKK